MNQTGNEFERFEHDRRRAVSPVSAQRVDHTAIVVQRKPIGCEWGAGHTTAQPLEPVKIVSGDTDVGVQREMLDVAAQLARDEAWTYVLSAAAQELDRSASLGPERHAAGHLELAGSSTRGALRAWGGASLYTERTMAGIRLSDPLGSGFDELEVEADPLPGINTGGGFDLPGVLGGGGSVPLGATPIVGVERDWDPPSPDTTALANVGGRTLAQAGVQLQALGEWGRGGGAIRSEAHPVAIAGGFLVRLRGNLIKRLPTWSGYASASHAAKDEWDRMIAKLDAHEQRHLDIAIEEADACAADLLGKDMSQVPARVSHFNARMARRQRELDRDTDSGTKSGVPYGDITLDTSIT